MVGAANSTVMVSLAFILIEIQKILKLMMLLKKQLSGLKQINLRKKY